MAIPEGIDAARARAASWVKCRRVIASNESTGEVVRAGLILFREPGRPLCRVSAGPGQRGEERFRGAKSTQRLRRKVRPKRTSARRSARKTLNRSMETAAQ